MAADPSDTGPDAIGYAEAVAELEEILAQLDGDDVDVDHLGAQVRRAAELIALCRQRLDAARMEVTRIVADLDGLTPTDAGTGAAVLDELDDVDPGDDDLDDGSGEGLFARDEDGEEP